MSDVDNSQDPSNAQVSGGQPAKAVATGEAAAPPGDAPATDDADQPEGDKPGGKKPIGPRISELTAKRREAERRADAAERLAERLAEALAGRGGASASGAPAKPADDTGPKQSDYRTYEEYLDARADWRAERRFNELVEKRTGEANRRSQEQNHAERMEEFHGALEEQAAAVEGYDEAADAVFNDARFPISPPMAEFLMDAADHKALMVKWLADNRTEAARIYKLSPAAAAKELAKVDSRLGTAPTPRATKAPPPPPSVGGRSAPQKDPSKMSMDEYAKHRGFTN